MSKFELLLVCIRSGQMTGRQIVEAMQDPHFAAYYKQRVG